MSATFTTLQTAIDALGRPVFDCETDGVHAESAQILTGVGLFVGCALTTDGSGTVTAECFDGTDDTGKALHPVLTLTINDRGPVGIMFPRPVQVATGIYLKVTGTGGTANVYHKPPFVPA
jgi:hypothetical protein